MAHTGRPVSRRPLESSTLREAAGAFGLDPAALEFVRDVANIVYRHEGPNGADRGVCFLRLTDAADRAPGEVRAEIDWIRYLADTGLPVCRPLPARDGAWTVQLDGETTASCFARVRGRPCLPEDFDERIFRLMGRFLGRLHRVSAGYAPPPGSAPRLHWHELDPPERVLASWSAEDDALARRFTDLRRRLADRSGASGPEGGYGLIHGDVHRGNIFVHDGGIDVYDFDDCCRAPLAMDVAHALFHSLWDRRYQPEDERAAFADRFLARLLEGYRGERAFGDEELALLPDLLEYRELAVDAFSHRRHTSPDAETRRRWAHVRDRLARGAPYVRLAGS